VNKTASKKDQAGSIRIVQADLDLPAHQQAVLKLVDAYSMDPMGDGKPLSKEVRNRLLAGLREQPTTLILMAYEQNEPVGIAVCFGGFSTFAARPLINIHDLAVLPDYRGRGIGRRLLEAVEQKAREKGCCKLTLEVQEKNRKAKAVYEAAGFTHAVHQEGAGKCLFLSKRL
jgi:GNAT superfamily N-acetyltransferase